MGLIPRRSSWRAAATLLLIAAATVGAAAQDYWPFPDPDERLEQYDPPSLPETLRGTVRPPAENAVRPARIDRIGGIFQAIQACWRRPVGSGFSGQEITLRISFKRNGEVLGQPRITYYRPGTEKDQREPFTRSVREAFERCTPLPLTESLGAAIAGRIFAFRFIDSRPM